MKILVLQLARLGDVYQSWPALRALRRKHPEAQIDVVTRERFALAWEGLTAVDNVNLLPVAKLLEKLLATPNSEQGAEKGIVGLREFLQPLREEKYTWIINLSFSPLSSHLTHALADSNAKVSGYSRFEDGYLNLPDAMSAYFYAQVGPDRPNRYHLCEIFGTICEVDLQGAPAQAGTLDRGDWMAPDLPTVSRATRGEYICIHVGGSESHKAISVSKWISILSHLRKVRPIEIVLIGSQSEEEVARQIQLNAPDGEVVSLAGELTLLESMAIIRDSLLLVGPDSAPLHMAALVNTPVLNLSIGEVKFWETGPRSSSAVVLPGATEDDLPSDIVADFIVRMVQGQRLPFGTIVSASGAPSFVGHTSQEASFEWEFIQALYTGSQFPSPVDPLFEEGMKQLHDANAFMVETLKSIKSKDDLQLKAGLLDRAEEVISTIAKLVPSLAPLVRWYMTEKVRVGPCPIEEIRKRNLETQELFQSVIEIYHRKGDSEPQAETESSL